MKNILTFFFGLVVSILLSAVLYLVLMEVTCTLQILKANWCGGWAPIAVGLWAVPLLSIVLFVIWLKLYFVKRYSK